MKIGIMSDSHDNLTAIRLAVKFFRQAGISHLIHAGDIVASFSATEILAASVPVTAVFGNNDGEKAGLRDILGSSVFEPPYAFVTHFEPKRKILLTHDLSKVDKKLYEEVDVVIHGHSHKVSVVTEGKTKLINPGENCGWLYGKSSIITLDWETLEAEVHYIALPGDRK